MVGTNYQNKLRTKLLKDKNWLQQRIWFIACFSLISKFFSLNWHYSETKNYRMNPATNHIRETLCGMQKNPTAKMIRL